MTQAEIPIVEFEKKDIKTSYCIDLDTRDRQVAENIRRIKGRLGAHSTRPGRIAVVCYGPSLEDTWEEIRGFDAILTCSGAHKFLIDHGIIPTYHAEVDPRPHKAELIGKPHKDVQYLLASVCHRDVLDLLEGYDVKLWHVFAHEADREGIPITYPRGEWALTGGSNVGLRCMVLARFLGYEKLTVFGMDYSFKTDGTQHAGWHPKEIPNVYAVEVDGEMFFTNPPMHQYAQQFFHEVAKLGNFELDVRGHGLLQAQIREYKKTKPLIPYQSAPAMLAATSPMVITPEYAALNRKLHETDPSYGISGSKRAATVRQLVEKTAPKTILDYGCGKGALAAALPFPIWEYDPCVPGKDAPPRPADLVICTDVLEHVEPECLDAVLLDLGRCTLKVTYVLLNTGPALKTLADGRNAHLIQQPLEWWKEKFEQFFSVATITQNGVEVTAILGQKPKGEKKPVTAPSLDFSKRITPARHDGVEIKFWTPNEQTHWRARSLFTKEPATIEWIDTFKAGDVFFDVGANVGGYSVWAAARRGVKVFAFEPEATNYALLCKNIILNQIDANAYCVALTDENKFASIFLSSQEPGGSCHSFGVAVGPNLKERIGVKQGCIGYPLDMVAQNLTPPDHIKIDVDGLEHKVIAGAKRILESGWVKSLLVEVNTNLPEHMEMVNYLNGIGFKHDPIRAIHALRKEGAFKGCGEYVFTREVQLEPLERVVDLNNVTVNHFPFPWFYERGIFPADTYAEMLARMPTDYTPIEASRNVRGYPERFTASPKDPFWLELFARLRDGQLKRKLCHMFEVSNPDELKDECLLIRDLAGYHIGPHTDSPQKVITALFYLPKDDALVEAGTSIYEPKEAGFTCKGGPHYESKDFTRWHTMPFKPNSMFAFKKTDNSFHGVEPCAGTRDVLLYDIRRK